MGLYPHIDFWSPPLQFCALKQNFGAQNGGGGVQKVYMGKSPLMESLEGITIDDCRFKFYSNEFCR